MKRVTLIYLSQTGAGPVYSLEMARALAKSGKCELQIIVTEKVLNLDVWEASFSTSNPNIHLNIVKAYGHTKWSVFIQFFNFIRKWRIVRLIKNFHPDVLYVPFGLLWSNFIYAFISSKIKIVETIHDVVAHDKFNLAEFVSSLLTIGSCFFVDGYVILNKKEKLTIQNRYRKPVIVIPHASYDYYFSKNRQGSEIVHHRIGFLGRIEPYKGLDILVDAMEKTKTIGLRLLIAGNGSIESKLLDKISNNSSIELINRYIQDNEFQSLLDRVDFVVLPYKRASQSGVIPMCFAYGKTVIVTKVGALSEQVPEGTGIITEPNSNLIAEQIDKLYNHHELIFEYGLFAKKYAEKELTWEHSAQLLLSFVDSLETI